MAVPGASQGAEEEEDDDEGEADESEEDEEDASPSKPAEDEVERESGQMPELPCRGAVGRGRASATVAG